MAETTFKIDQLYCDVCPIRNKCHSLCRDMKILLEDKKAKEQFFSEIPTDPLKMDYIQASNHLFKIVFDGIPAGTLSKVKDILVLAICDFIEFNLSKKQKEVIVMYFWGQYTEKKIGQIIGTTKQDINEKLWRGIGNIRKYLKKYDLL